MVQGNTSALRTEIDSVRAQLAEHDGLDAELLSARRPFSADPPLGYAPQSAANFETIQASSLALDSAALGVLDQRGFVIAKNSRFPSFGYGYEVLYAEDLPLYVSADSVLEAVHRSYDDILLALELGSLIPELHAMLQGMRETLRHMPPARLSVEATHDIDFYLAVAEALLHGAHSGVVAGADQAAVDAFVRGAEAGNGWQQRTIFGVERHIDFSQFTPRGHYEQQVTLQHYFRAMMWLGRIDFRIVETDKHGSPIFHRRQLEAALALDELIGDATRASWQRIDATIESFVGESDSMRLPELSGLRSALGIASVAELSAHSDESIFQAIIDGGFGAQRIASHIMINGRRDATMPLNRSFLLFGQRYVVDSHVFSNLVYDRLLPAPDGEPRLLPDPLDVAFAVFGNDEAARLLRDELDKYAYAPALESMRDLVDRHEPAFWSKNLYNLRLAAARGMSPAADEIAAGRPTVMAGEGWRRRLLNTQLASWAELRHDTILYAKQSYTAGFTCEFPDAYVDPYPETWAALEAFATQGIELANLAGNATTLRDRIADYFVQTRTIVSQLREMAEYQLDGQPFTEAHMTFINQAVRLTRGCGGPTAVEGWFGRLYFDRDGSGDEEPIVADVHTQPTDVAGQPVGKVLHVGTARPSLIVITANTCNGPRAYAGLVSSYHEHITENFDRLTDSRWAKLLEQAPPSHPTWMTPILGGN
jgi:hypothetical protein